MCTFSQGAGLAITKSLHTACLVERYHNMSPSTTTQFTTLGNNLACAKKERKQHNLSETCVSNLLDRKRKN
jgi:hypothetical protein